MADEPQDDNAENTASSPEGEDAPAQAAEAGGAEPEAVSAEAAEAASPEPEADTVADAEQAGEADDAVADEPAAQAPAAASSPQGEPVEQLSPKERRRKARAKKAGEARPSRSPEERHAERVAERRVKAARRRARRLQERAKAATRRAGAPAKEALAPVHPPVEGKRKVRQGVVVSNKAEKTITVRIDVAHRHRRYEKVVRSSSTVHAHDENNDAHEGDVVRVIESRPLSRTKRWALVDVVERAR